MMRPSAALKHCFFDYRRQHNLRIKVARIFNTYGHACIQMMDAWYQILSQALLGRDLTVYGDGTQTRSFCYVDDLIDGLMKLMATKDEVTGPINIGNPTEFPMLELASTLIEMTGSRSRIVHRPLPENDPRQRRPDISRTGIVVPDTAHSVKRRIDPHDCFFW